MMKQITIFPSDDEWKELVDTVRRELGETVSEEEIGQKVRNEVKEHIKGTYLYGLGV